MLVRAASALIGVTMQEFLIIVLVLLAALYFLPTIVALVRGKDSTLAIGVLNLLLGWTLIGWAVALVWAAAGDGRGRTRRASRL